MQHVLVMSPLEGAYTCSYPIKGSSGRCTGTRCLQALAGSQTPRTFLRKLKDIFAK
jgi:hypothetical protein